jgi:hypothetical protein
MAAARPAPSIEAVSHLDLHSVLHEAGSYTNGGSSISPVMHCTNRQLPQVPSRAGLRLTNSLGPCIGSPVAGGLIGEVLVLQDLVSPSCTSS